MLVQKCTTRTHIKGTLDYRA